MPTTIYDTIVVPNSFFDGVCVGSLPNLLLNGSCFGPIGMSFTSPAVSPTSFRLGLYLVGTDPNTFTIAIPPTNGTTLVSLLANDPTAPAGPGGQAPPGIAPGATLVDLGSLSDTAMLASYQTYYFYSNYVLAPSTRYWIYIQDVSITAQAVAGAIAGCGWGWISSGWPPPGAIGVAGEYFWNYESSPEFPVSQGGPFGAFFNDVQHTPYQMQIVVYP